MSEYDPCPEPTIETGVEGFWSNFLFKGKTDNKKIKQCSNKVGLGGMLFFRTQKEAEQYAESNFIPGFHSHDKWLYSNIVGTVYMAGETHLIAEIIEQVKPPITPGKMAIINSMKRTIENEQIIVNKKTSNENPIKLKLEKNLEGANRVERRFNNPNENVSEDINRSTGRSASGY